MPSFLADDLPPASSPHSPILDPVRHSHEKINSIARPSWSRQHSSKNGVSNGSPRADIMNGSSPRLSSEMFSDGGLSSLPNGRSSAGSWDNENKSSRNGSALSVNGGTNGMSEIGRKSTASQNGFTKRTSTESETMNGGPVQPPKDEPNTKPSIHSNGGLASRINLPPPVSTNPQSTGPLTYQSSLLPATPVPESPRPVGTSSPHRFSSPPAYLQAGPLAPSSTPQPQANPPPLKHRHTLQVPKAQPARASSEDAAYSSGRFSPTIAQSVRRGSLSLVRRNTRSIHSDMPHEEIPQDEDALRWAEAIRQKRASKRRRKEDEDDDRVVVGTKVDQNHVNWVTAYNMLTGIRFTVSRTNAKLDRQLTEADFEARHKFSFDITGNELTPSAKYDFKFKDYAPWVFRELRAKFKLDPADYLMSLTSKYILSELGSPGKSGSFFYFSRDYKYIIKTIHHAEHKLLRKILKDYYNHVKDNPNTLLSQFYGLHRVKIPYGRKIHFVVMNNLFPPHRDIHQTFDLKGSTIGRDFKEEDLQHNPRATLKDLNWLRRNLHLEFGPEKKAIFIQQMERDVHLLQKLKIMDYSMLVGIHDLEKGNQENLRDKTLRVFQPGGEAPKDEAAPQHSMLMRTPSKLENARKARELRQIIKQEKPVPMGSTLTRMPDQMEENAAKRAFTFYSNDGGFQATHEDNRPGDEIYYLGIIDLLTHYGTVKRLEHFWKGLSHDKSQISPIQPAPYGDRFIKFIQGITKTKEEAERELAEREGNDPNSQQSTDVARRHLDSRTVQRTNTDNTVIQDAEDSAVQSEKRGASEATIPDRTLGTMRSPSTDHGNDRTGTTLPIVDEVGESSSTGGRSGQSRERHDGDDGDDRPPTPPKDKTPANSLRVPSKEPLRGRGSSVGSNKALPPIPRAESPERMTEKESIVP